MSFSSQTTRALLFMLLILASSCKVGIKKYVTTFSHFNLVPAILNVVPPNSGTAGGVQITITGQGFATGATVTIGAVACNSVVFVSANEIQCVVPAHAVGSLPLVVTDPNQLTASASFLYFVAAQSAPNFTTSLGGGPSVGHAGGLGVSAISAIGEPLQAKHQSAVGVSVKSGIVSVTSP